MSLHTCRLIIPDLIFLLRWVSLIIVMSGVALVGYSGSLVKDAVKEAVVHHLARALGLHHDASKKAIEEPEVTKVLVGECTSPTSPPILIGYHNVNVLLVRYFLRVVCASLVSLYLILDTFRS